MNYMKSSGAFCCVFQCQTVGKGNQHGGREYDDLQNWLYMTSHVDPLLGRCIMWYAYCKSMLNSTMIEAFLGL